jgi:hypothetical protein
MKDLSQDCDVIIVPSIARIYVHFDYYIFVNGEYVDKQESTSGPYGGFNLLSFQLKDIKKYILSEDKKTYRSQSTDYFALFDGKITSDKISAKGYPDHLIPRGSRGRYRIKSLKCIPVKICPRCARAFDHDSYTIGANISDFSKCKYSETIFKFSLCDNNLCHSNKTSVFWNPKNEFIDEWGSSIKDPRAFLYEFKVKPKKSFFKKYISRHLNRVRKLRPISQQEVSFFRSWLGAKDIAALAN